MQFQARFSELRPVFSDRALPWGQKSTEKKKNFMNQQNKIKIKKTQTSQIFALFNCIPVAHWVYYLLEKANVFLIIEVNWRSHMPDTKVQIYRDFQRYSFKTTFFLSEHHSHSFSSIPKEVLELSEWKFATVPIKSGKIMLV